MRVLLPPLLWRARWLRSRGRISHLLRIVREYIAEMSCEHVSLFQPKPSDSGRHLGDFTGTHPLLQKVPAAVDRAAQNKKEERLWLFGSSPSDRSTRNWLHVDISESLEMRKDVNRGSCQSQSRDSRAPHPASLPESRLPPTSRWLAKP